MRSHVCRAREITGILVLRATHSGRTLSLPFHENFLSTVRPVGHRYAILNLSRLERLSLHMRVEMWPLLLDTVRRTSHVLSGDRLGKREA